MNESQSDQSLSSGKSEYYVGQEISNEDVEDVFRLEVGEDSRTCDVVLSDGSEARLDEIGERRYRIREIWRAGDDPYRFS